MELKRKSVPAAVGFSRCPDSMIELFSGMEKFIT